MTDVKTIQTRLQLKYDTYANWTDETQTGLGANLVLLKGEIGICAIEDKSQGAQTAPTVLFKVGDGENAFKDLKWASALAADVYAWAKSDTVSFNATAEQLEFKTGSTVNHSIPLTHFAKATVVADHTSRIAELETALGLKSDEGTENTETISTQIANILERLGTIQGADTVEGSIAKALKDAKKYADDAVTVAVGNYVEGEEGTDDYKAASGLRKEIADAEAAAKAYAASEVSAAVRNQATVDAAQNTEIEKKLDKTTYEAYISGKTMSDEELKTYADGKASAAQSAAVAAAAEDAAAKVKAFEDGTFSALNTRVAAIDTAYQAADTALGDRITNVEGKLANVANVMDFVGARTVTVDAETKAITVVPAEGESFNKGDVVVDGTGKEYVYDGEAWHEFGYADSNAAAISTLQGRVTTAEGEITALKPVVAAKVDTETFNNWKQTHEADHADKQTEIAKAISAEETARKAADKEINDKIGTAEDAATIATVYGAIAAAKKAGVDADAKATDVANRMTTAEGNITTLQDIVINGDDTNAKLRGAITELQNIVKTGADANATLRADLTTLQNVVNNETTGLAATKAIADQNKTDIGDLKTKVAAIESDYLKAADQYIFNCGDSKTTAVYAAPVAN